MQNIILLACVGFLIFLIMREFNCWYFKFNKIVKLLESIDSKLTQKK